MNIIIIVAGGAGKRTGNSVPKQFLTVFDVPIIVYTMKTVFNSKCYDELYVVCSEGWSDFVYAYAEQYKIDIFKGVIANGQTRFDSFTNGIESIVDNHDANDIVSILDGNRPMTPSALFRDGIRLAYKADCVLPLEPCFDSMYVVNQEDRMINSVADRSILYKGQGPETSKLGVAAEICKKAKQDHINDMTLTGLMIHYGKKVAYIEGSSKNFKITTSDDLALFKAMASSIMGD